MGVKMQKFVYITDIHYGAKPVCRKDDYNAAILKKLEYVFKIAEKQKAVMLIGGDLFDKGNQSFFALIKLIDLFSKYKDTVPVYINWGNHSHDGHPENSPLTLMEHSGLITTSRNIDYVDFDGVRVIFAPNSVNPMSKDEHIKDGVKNYLMTHHLIVEKPLPYTHFLMDDFKTNCDLVFCADYHPYQGIQKYNDVVFVAPGSIARRKLTSGNLEKEIKGVIIKGEKIVLFDIPFTNDVWVESQHIEEHGEIDLHDFQKHVDSLDIEVGMSLEHSWSEFTNKFGSENEAVSFISSKLFNK